MLSYTSTVTLSLHLSRSTAGSALLLQEQRIVLHHQHIRNTYLLYSNKLGRLARASSPRQQGGTVCDKASS